MTLKGFQDKSLLLVQNIFPNLRVATKYILVILGFDISIKINLATFVIEEGLFVLSLVSQRGQTFLDLFESRQG